MAKYKDSMHGRLKLIIKNSGGYDFNFHIAKVAKEENVNIKIVREIFLMISQNDLRDKYIKMYKEGISLENIRKIENVRRDNFLNKTLGLLSVLNQSEWWNNR